jgi:dihydrofolate synthase/folylpolyglutamate synthase
MYQRIGAAAYKADLNTTIKLDDYFGNPHKHYKTIHIAGTNGKGSVSHSLASVLQEAGYKTGLYTSPHLVDYRERIRVNGEKISKEFVTDFINNNLKVLKELKPSFFEMSVALAFEYFRFMKVDIAVIEVGMGGRLDSTNIINPIISVITNIDYDHTQFLGDTKEKIAVEKAGIIKPKVPVIIGESSPETDNVFLQKAKSENSRILFTDKISTCEQIKSDFENSIYRFSKNGISNEFNFALGGNYQHKNLNLIING